MTLTGNKPIDAAIEALQNALKAEAANGNYPNNHASLFILRPQGAGKGTIAAGIVLGCHCQTCTRMVAKSAAQNMEALSKTPIAAVH